MLSITKRWAVHGQDLKPASDEMVGPNIEEFNRMKARINCTDKIHKIKLNK